MKVLTRLHKNYTNGRATESQQKRQRRGKHGLSVIGRAMPVAASETSYAREQNTLKQYQTEKTIGRRVRSSRRGKGYEVRHEISDAW